MTQTMFAQQCLKATRLVYFSCAMNKTLQELVSVIDNIDEFKVRINKTSVLFLGLNKL